MFPLVTKKQAAERIGLHPEHLMRMVRDGRFPKPVRFGPTDRHAVRFLKSEIDDWIAARIAEREGGATK